MPTGAEPRRDRLLLAAWLVAVFGLSALRGARPLLLAALAAALLLRRGLRRNLNRRVEVLVPIERRRSRDYLLDYLQTQLDDTQQAWTLDAHGLWHPVRKTSPTGLSCHAQYMNAARTRLS